MTPCVVALQSTRCGTKMVCSTIPTKVSTVAATRSIASRARSGLHTLTFNISQLPSPRNWAMAGGSNGYRAALVSRQLTPGLISSSRETAGFPPFISFSTSFPDLDSAAHDTTNDERFFGNPGCVSWRKIALTLIDHCDRGFECNRWLRNYPDS